MWKRNGVRRAVGRGSANTVTLAEAREQAANDRKIVREGGDPPKARGLRAGVPTFGECADAYIASNEAAWGNAKHRYQVRLALTRYAAALRPLLVNQIGTEQVLAVLTPLWKSKTETAKRLRQRVEAVLDYAKAHQYLEAENPARWRGHLDKILPAPDRLARVVHMAAMPYGDVPAFMAKLRGVDGIAARALEFVILTVARVGEVRGAVWGEINLADKLWTIPSGRMKAGKEHRVPLSDRAMTIIREMEKLRASEFVFPGFRDNRPLGDVTVRAVLHKLGVTDAVIHGFRSTFADWAGDETARRARNHRGGISAQHQEQRREAAYRRNSDEYTRSMINAYRREY